MASSLDATWTCQECRRPTRGAKHRTMTGRVVCGRCERLLASAAVGLLTTSTPSEAAVTAVGVHGIRERLRRLLGKRD